MRRLTCVVPFLAIGWVAPALAQDATTAAPSMPSSCNAPENRQFDFWVGAWSVTASGEQAGTNNVTLEERGCLVHEHWNGTSGETGQSLNYYDRADHHWHQVWVSSTGEVLPFTGEYHGGRMVFIGTRPGARSGAVVRHRLTFTLNNDGSVRQLWEASRNAGKTWKTLFDGLYRKKTSP